MVDGVSLIFFEIDIYAHKISSRCQAYFNLYFSSVDNYILNIFRNYVFNI